MVASRAAILELLEHVAVVVGSVVGSVVRLVVRSVAGSVVTSVVVLGWRDGSAWPGPDT